MRRHRVPSAAAAWLVVTGVTAWLWVLGRGALRTPPLLHPGHLAGWWTSQQPVVAVVALARVALLLVGSYFVLLLAMLSLTQSWRRRLRLPGARWLVCLTVGAATAAAVSPSASATASGTGPASSPVPELRYLGPASTGRTPIQRPDRAPRLALAPAPADRRPPAQPTTTAARPRSALRIRRASPGHAISTVVPSTLPVAPQPRVWIVQPGDDLWSIAEATLASATGSRPDVRTVAGYWQQVVAVNRSDLVDPNLIFPGDRIALPPV